MRAVHFHPHGMPLVLTAEVQDPTPTPDLHPTLTERAPYAGQEPNAAAPTAAAAAAERTPEEAASTYRAPLETSVPASSTGGWRYPPQTLPPSMVPVGWEVPFPAAPPRNTRGQQGEEHEVAEGGSGNLAAQLAAANYANYASVWNILGEEQPPRVRLRLWHFDAAKASTELDDARALRMTVSDAVLCSEMGVHFSPCGRYIAATVASRGPIPAPAVDAAAAVVSARAVEGMDWSPMRGPHQAEDAQQALPLLRADNASVSGYVKVQPGGPLPSPRPERVVFEVRVISIDGCTFGETARARRIRAAHCLTSVQFSPAGGHLLLAYGKKHSSLLRSLVADRGALLPLHTILEVIRLSDMELVRVLPSAEDEINAACFHPLPGCGLAYGTKEGRLRLVVHRRADEDEDTAGNDAHEDGSSAQDDEQRRSAHELGLALMQQQWMQPAELRQALAPGPAPALH